MGAPSESHRPASPVSAAEERVLERRFYESGAVQFERATLRQLTARALPAARPKRDPLWMTVTVWVLSAFGRGLWLLGELLATILAAAFGLIGAIVILLIVIAAMIGFVGLGHWIGTQVGGNTGGAIGAATAAAVVLLIVVGAANPRTR